MPESQIVIFDLQSSGLDFLLYLRATIIVSPGCAREMQHKCSKEWTHQDVVSHCLLFTRPMKHLLAPASTYMLCLFLTFLIILLHIVEIEPNRKSSGKGMQKVESVHLWLCAKYNKAQWGRIVACNSPVHIKLVQGHMPYIFIILKVKSCVYSS